MRKRNGLSVLADEEAEEDAGADTDGRVGVDVGSAAKVAVDLACVVGRAVVETEVESEAAADVDAPAAGSTFANSTRMILPFHFAPSYVLMARFTLARSQRSVI